MASIRTRTRKNGTTYHSVLYNHHGTQSSLSFNDHNDAEQFRDMVNRMGPDRALEILNIDRPGRNSPTVAAWVDDRINHLTGVDHNTTTKYRAYLRNDITPHLGDIPLDHLGRDDIARWIQAMADAGARAKTIHNKHGFLSGCLSAAVTAGHLTTNPCTGHRLPTDDNRHTAVFLTSSQFKRLLDAVTEPWQPLVRFLAVSGARWSEAAALQPADINPDDGTVHIRRAWKYEGAGRGYRIGRPKSLKSLRTINVDPAILNSLDLTGDWLFTNRNGGPVRYPGFKRRVWDAAVTRADLNPRPTPHDLRHTCASWMIAAGTPLPVIQDHLGHESITTTISVYGHLDRSAAQAAAAHVAAAAHT